MDMGTGKSKVAIDLIVNRGHKKTLLVCPKRVIEVWPGQFKTHSDGINVVPLRNGTGVQKAEVIRGYKGPYPVVFVTNYDIVWQDSMKPTLLKAGFDCVVLDESHRIKKPGGKASRFFHLLGKTTPWKIALTGTPLAHSPLDIYGQYRFLDPSIFGTNYAKFCDKYCVENKYSHKKTFINQDELSRLMYSIAFRVEAGEVLKLPEPIEQTFTFELPSPMMRAYKTLEKESVMETTQGLVAVNNPLARMTRLHQMTSGIMIEKDGTKHIMDRSKAGILADILEDLPVREPVVIFARFTDDLDNIRRVCESQGRRYSEVSGRGDQLKDWQKGHSDIVGVQIQSGSEGEDYTRSHYAIYYSLGFSLKDYKQSRRRIDRPGQTKNPMFIHILAEGTIDEDIMRALEANAEVVDYVTDTWRRENRGS